MMISMKLGKVVKILSKVAERTKIIVSIDEKDELAINYNFMTGDIQVNDEVILNTTAVELNLGTGGYHFVVYNLNYTYQQLNGKGHIMKCRYSPLQLKVFTAEEQESPNHEVFHNFVTLDRLPVLVGTLHSMVAPIAATIKHMNLNVKIAYIMTDAAALPIYFSDTVYNLKNKGLIDTTITVGHAFGGDIETVNIYNGLISAKEIAKCDIAIVAMGPGIVGTGTPYGFSGIEQGQIIDIVNDLDGLPIGIPRISFGDQRQRHYGVSHHSLTIFSKITKTRCQLVLPVLSIKEQNYIYNQIESLKINEKHNIIEVDGSILSNALDRFNLTVKTMGRGYAEDSAFFLACSAAAVYSYNQLFNDDKK
ncbi:Protein of unknown function [Anaerovirgula multivorans]|uniref:DUF3866 domain-containing protein n=1 Tax=Anaerovirgula multivorans TaxID=312168 RepID=A0A238ZVZ7_9FIRM|nr:DUF3866 family protein [Anaerovirgula multivorans]SNR87068.1 Protein of unknown function [Anaerovirgula multivorans]